MADHSTVSLEDARRLLQAATRSERIGLDLAERRRQMMPTLAEIVHADAGHWARGRGNPLTSDIAPVAVVEHGYTSQEITTLIEHTLKPESIAMFQTRVIPLLNRQRNVGVTRRDVIGDEEWKSSALWQEYVGRIGFDSWLHAISYQSDDTWSCLHFLRRIGREEFGAREAAMADLALSAVEWLSSRAEERTPPKAFANLTPRQRTVMLVLLDGKSRREIASSLGISEYTVDDHIGAVYAHFGVGSLGELAAKFLRMA